MRKITKLILLTAIVLAWGSNVSDLQAADYCQAPITATDGVTTVKLSCQLISVGNYQIKVESDVAMTNFAAGVYCNINDVGGNQVISLPGYVRSADGLTITVDIPSSSAPNLYTPLYILMPGEKNFSWPTGITWGTCSAQSDFTLPVMGTAVLVGSPTYNSANITFTGTDDVTNPVTNYVLNDAENSITNKVVVVDASGNGTITGLSPAITYNFTVKARDAAFNESANSASLQLTTVARPSECTGDKGHFGNPTVKSINYTIQYIGGNTVYTITPFDAARTIDFAEVQTTAGNNAMTIAVDGKSATYTKTGLTVGANVGVLFMYSLDNIGGNEMTAQNSALTDVNSIYYKVGECDVSDSEAPTAFTATKGTVGAMSVELLLNATDNLGIIAYTVSYGSAPTIVTQNGTSGTQKSFVVSGLEPSTEYTFSIEAKDAAGNPALNNPLTITATTTEFTAAPTPAVDASKVISIFSDTYTATPNSRQDWYGNNFSMLTLAGNNSITKNSSICCFGYEFTAKPINVSAMNKLHVDIYPETLASLSLGITDGADRMKTGITLIANQWNSVDLLLSELIGANLNAVNQVGFWNLNGTFYFDNLYFYNDLGTSVSEVATANGISCFPNPIMDQFTVNAKSEISQLIICNLVGQTVKSIAVSGLEKTIDLSDVSTGNYFVTVKLANGQFSTQKIVKL